MNASRLLVGFMGLVFALTPSAVYASETWYCEYADYRHTGTDQSLFHVEGDRLVENSGDVIVDYHLLEDSAAAIVAAKGGSYASKPWVMGFLLMIRKSTGEFVLTTTSTGSENGRQTGHCRLTVGANSN